MSYQALNLVIQIHLLGTKAPNTPRKMRDCETSKGHHNTDNGRKHRRQSEKALSSLFVDFFYSQQKNKVIKLLGILNLINSRLTNRNVTG